MSGLQSILGEASRAHGVTWVGAVVRRMERPSLSLEVVTLAWPRTWVLT
jgi:hypothetical protein